MHTPINSNFSDYITDILSNISVTGTCIIFAGIRTMTLEEQLDIYFYEDYDGKDRWFMESDEKTKHRILSGLLSIGINCNANDIIIEKKCDIYGTKHCKCMFYYPKSHDVDNFLEENGYLDIYIDGLSGFDFMPNGPLEFTITKNEM